MIFKKILCVVKKTELEKYQIHSKKIIPEGIKKWLNSGHENHLNFLTKFKEIASKYDLPITYISTNQVKTIKQEYDLIITIGGDGSFLLATKYFKNKVLLGFNSNYDLDPKQGSVGALTSGNILNLEKRLKQLKEGNFKIISLPLLSVKINEKPTKIYAVNEIYLGNKKPYQSSDLTIIYKKKEERFNCSGMLISTFTGSTAWYKNSGGKAFNEGNVSFLIREQSQDPEPKLIQGVLKEEEILTVYPNSPGHIISFDSRDQIVLLQTFDKIEISLSKNNVVRVVEFL